MGSFTQLTYHVVFATKFRHKTITPSLQHKLYEYIGGIIRARNASLIEVGGVSDHIHLLTRLSPKIAVADVIRDIKAISSKWMNESDLVPKKFEWQIGYGAFTVSYSKIESVEQYIQKQKNITGRNRSRRNTKHSSRDMELGSARNIFLRMNTTVSCGHPCRGFHKSDCITICGLPLVAMCDDRPCRG